MGSNGANRYSIEPGQSQFRVRVSAGGMLSAFGHSPTIAIREFSGDIRFTPEKPESSELGLTIKSNSLEVVDDISDKDRKEIETTMRQEVLEVSRFPEVRFTSTEVTTNKGAEGQYNLDIKGRLELHGVTRSHQIPVRLILQGGLLRAQGEFSLLQSDYGLKPVSAVGGTLKVKDNLKFSFDIVAREKST